MSFGFFYPPSETFSRVVDGHDSRQIVFIFNIPINLNVNDITIHFPVFSIFGSDHSEMRARTVISEDGAHGLQGRSRPEDRFIVVGPPHQLYTRWDAVLRHS